jgi:Sec-independent protein translocase protein TatA
MIKFLDKIVILIVFIVIFAPENITKTLQIHLQ